MNKKQLSQLTANIYLLAPDHQTDRPILGLIMGSEKTLLVDAGNSSAHAKLLKEEINRLMLPFPNYLAITHWHWDHVFGIYEWNLPTFAHQITKQHVDEMVHLDWSDEALDERVQSGKEIQFCSDMIKLELPDRNSLKLKSPDITFITSIEIDLGDVKCEVRNVGGDHSADSNVIFVPKDRVLFIGDALSPDLYHGEWSYSIEKLFPLLENLLSFEAEWYIASHNPNPISREELSEYAEELKLIGTIVSQLGDNKEGIISELKKHFNYEPNEDQLDTINVFLAGLRKRN